ncbi:SLC13 family permease [Streptomonospora nanhaiensis]|uniref:SLC13 family permease n=1 Tax=Streptomonospora nanhaiensis TaxID=1323731 RepID=A0ABY6YUD6_9ACTN|nr:SLC13 family permease [Streptomonospora nanhaiensis]WAE75813.1 SLC13 family permease [Streptomonospora nanhaiensis]
MPAEVISIVVLVLVFLIATLTSVHMGALALFAAFVVALAVAGESTDDVFGGFPGDLFVVLVGVTYLFALARNNGTVDWLIQAAVRGVGGRVALIPWVMFGVTAVLTAAGAVVPAAVAIVAPVGLGFALRFRINPVLMGLLIINGASAGGFSPMSIYGTITNGVVARNGLEGSPLLLFAATFAFNVLLSVAVFFLFGGRSLLGRREGEESAPTPPAPEEGGGSREALPGPAGGGTAPAAAPGRPGGPTATATRADGGGAAATVEEELIVLTGDRVLTLLGIAVLGVGALAFGLDVGLTAISVAVVLSIVSPGGAKGVVDQVAWPTVLLICGIVTYVGLMERMGTIDFLGGSVASIGIPLLAALVICVVGGAVSAFASTTGILGAVIPLAVPFLLVGEVGAIGMITALAISSSVVDSSPFSTSGALVVANATPDQRDLVFRRLMVWGMSMIVVAPLLTWGILVLPGWL